MWVCLKTSPCHFQSPQSPCSGAKLVGFHSHLLQHAQVKISQWLVVDFVESKVTSVLKVTEGLYVDFLNSLDPGIATPYFPNVGGGNRNTLELVDGVYQSSAPDRACGYIGGVSRILTDLDWAGLRPMTELKFE
ncbi:hypothetical protein N9F73_00245 [bacterium]|nr:hypothetical protein [bacterium]